MTTIIETYSDTAALVAAAGDRLVAAIAGAIAARGQANIVLTGGGTGIGMLKHVGEYSDEIEWEKVHVYWGDERFVPHDDGERNDKQAREALLDHVSIPPTNVHAMAASDGEFGDDLDAAADGYAELLIANFDAPGPEFDVHLLGMGGEGHINSLFPDTAAVRETERFVSTAVRSMSGRMPVTGSARPIVVSSPLLKKYAVPVATSTRRWRVPFSAGFIIVASSAT